MTARRLFVVLFIIALFTMGVRETLDPDMWWHLRTGRLILEEGIPRSDPFSFTVPGKGWITHEWLSEVIMYCLYRAGGLIGLILAFGALVTATFWLLLRRCRGRPYLAVFLVLTATLAAAPFWGVRPQVFNMLGAAIFVFMVEGYREGGYRRAIFLLPVLTALWANLHSGYILGVVLLATYVTGEGISRRLGWSAERSLDGPSNRRLVLVTLLSALAAVLNPNGPALWTYPFSTLGSNAMQAYIQEWQSPNFHQPIFWPFAALMALGLVAFVIAKKRPSLTDGLLFGGTAAAGLLSSRHIPLYAIVATPVIARSLMDGFQGTRLGYFLEEDPAARVSRPVSALNWILLVVFIFLAALWVTGQAQGNEAAIADRYPVEAVDYLERSGLDQVRGYNSYNWGGYLIWRGLPVFVDGRADVYGDDFLLNYRRTFDLTTRWREPLDAYDVAYILIEAGSPLSNLLSADAGWQQTYSDNIADVYVRE